MGLLHIVLFKLKPNYSANVFQTVNSGFNNMSKTIPYVLRSSFGENKTQRGKGYTHALVVELNSLEDLPKYIEHPHHQELVQHVKECAEFGETLAMDIEN